MQRYRSMVPCVVFAGALVFAGCSDDNGSTTGNTEANGSSSSNGGRGTSSNAGNSASGGRGGVGGLAGRGGEGGARPGGSGGAGGATAGQGGGGAGGRGGSGGAGGRGGSGGAGGATMSGGGQGGGSAGGAGGVGGTGGAGGATAVQLNDAQIASVSLTANMGEVNENMVALTKAQRADARDFAQDMVTMHNAALERERALGTALMLTPAENPTSQMLQSDSQNVVDKLNATSDDDFDDVYLQSQLDAHETVLKLIDDTLLPDAQNAQLKDELTLMRGAVVMHLDRVRALVAIDNGGSGGAGGEGDEGGAGGAGGAE